MAKSDLQARPIYHRTRDSIEAHLTIVFAALAVSRWIENTSGWSIRKFVKTARRCHTIELQAGTHTITATDPPPPANSAKPSKRSTAPAGLRTSLAEVRSDLPSPYTGQQGERRSDAKLSSQPDEHIVL
jgi:hypothetical protein